VCGCIFNVEAASSRLMVIGVLWLVLPGIQSSRSWRVEHVGWFCLGMFKF
jgi:hypothetical protein